MFNNLAKNKFFMVLPVAAALVLTGCDEEETVVPEPEAIDLTQTEDLFTNPVKANPLTADPSAVIVRVNGEDITRGEILELMNAAMQQLAGRVQPEQLPQIQSQMYERFKNELITKKLIDAAVAKSNIAITDTEVDETIEKIKNQPLPNGMTFEAALAAQGTTLEQLKENISTDLATRKFLETKTTDIADATEAEAKEFYDSNPNDFKKPETVAASHILLTFDATDTDVTKAGKKAELEKIRADIIAGTTTFEAAAQAHSKCPSSAQGGSLNTFGKGQMVPEFEVAAFSQEINEVGDVVETQFGYHIIKVTDHQDEGTVSFDETKAQIIPFLTNQKKQKAVGDFIASLRDSATIEELAQ
jgi:peptidyl-prolyl cis-trans isomerase C